jgi:3-hydroxyacyl-[acyl-carrier-protein] dehydratase
MLMDISEVMKILPHRYPFLLVDRILEHEPGKRIVGLKNVTINEPFFQGHFPGHPVMPGVLIIEGMAQVGGILAYHASDDEVRRKVCYFASIDNAKFRRPVRPGDQLRIVMEATACKRGIWCFSGKAYVDDKLVAEAELKATFADMDRQ